MKLRVIGWTDYDEERAEGDNGWAARNAIIDDIRQNGYEFSGWAHQEGANCAPVLNDGRIYRFSQRGWGDLMAEAHGFFGPMDYAKFAFPAPAAMERRPTRRVPDGFEPEQNLGERFSLVVSPADFDAARAGALTVSDYAALRYIYKGDELVLTCGDRQAAFAVVDAERVHMGDEMPPEKASAARRESARLSLVITPEEKRA